MQTTLEAVGPIQTNGKHSNGQLYDLQTNIHNDNFHLDEAEDIRSFNHSYLQSKLSALFLTTTPYLALTELSLDTTPIKAQFPEAGDSIVAESGNLSQSPGKLSQRCYQDGRDAVTGDRNFVAHASATTAG